MISTERISDKASLLLNSCGIDCTERIRRGSVRPRGRVDFHILYIARGECHVVLKDGEHLVKEGGLIFFLPGGRQEYFFEPNTGSVSYYIHFTGRDAKEILCALGFVGKNIFEAPKNRELERIFEQMHREYSLAQKAHESVTAGLLLSLLGIAARGISLSDAHIDMRKHARVKSVIERMYTDIDKSLSIETLAKECNYSVGYFSHLFRSVTGVSPHTYMSRLRIERAKTMLESTDASVLEIALAIGCEDQSYFSRFFKEQTGLSPTAYRARFCGVRNSDQNE
jgi:AraC-like DNA-binding protein